MLLLHIKFLKCHFPSLFDNSISVSNIIKNLQYYKHIAVAAVAKVPEMYELLCFLLQCDPDVKKAEMTGLIKRTSDISYFYVPNSLKCFLDTRLHHLKLKSEMEFKEQLEQYNSLLLQEAIRKVMCDQHYFRVKRRNKFERGNSKTSKRSNTIAYSKYLQ